MHYRLRQLTRALLGRIDANDQALVARLLTPAEQRLFARMARFDQRHALDVCRVLIAARHDEPALLCAALLHDCGKVADDGRPLPLLCYGLFVVIKRITPGLYQRAAADGRGVLRSFRIHATHETRSVALAAQAGSATQTLTILAHYQEAPAGSLGACLRWADNQC